MRSDMFTRPFMRSPVLLALLAAAALACQDDPQSPSSGTDGVTSQSGPAAAVTAAVYTIKDLGTLGGASAEANAINDQGGIVGWSTLANGRQHAFLYRAGRMRDLGALVHDEERAGAAGAQHQARDQAGEHGSVEVALADLYEIDAGGDGLVEPSLERQDFGRYGTRVGADETPCGHERHTRSRQSLHGSTLSEPGGAVGDADRRPRMEPARSRSPPRVVITPTPVTAPRT